MGFRWYFFIFYLFFVELKLFRETKSDEHTFLSIMYELRNRLNDAELETLKSCMKDVVLVSELVPLANNIIETVLADIKKRLLPIDKYRRYDLIRLCTDLFTENCKLRKVVNSYLTLVNTEESAKEKEFVAQITLENPANGTYVGGSNPGAASGTIVEISKSPSKDMRRAQSRWKLSLVDVLLVQLIAFLYL
jgi:hypothetical protein